MQCTNEWEIKNVARPKSLNPNHTTKHGEDEDDGTSGHMCYDPFHSNTNCLEEEEKNVVIESLYTLHQHC